MDRWLDGWIDEMDGWVEGRIDEMVEWMNESMDAHAVRYLRWWATAVGIAPSEGWWLILMLRGIQRTPITITIPQPHKHHCALLGMHRHYKGLPPSSRCLTVPVVSLHDPHSFIINHPHLSVVTVFFKLTSLSKYF